MNASRIAGTGSYLPSRILNNFDLEKLVDTSNDWILERTGIAQRHVAAPDEATSDLALKAAQKALEAAGILPKQLDAIIFATVTPDQVMPSAACCLQAKLGCLPILAFDLSAACSGFIYGMSLAHSLIQTGQAKHVLVVGAEVLSRIVNYKDRETCVLFGDGAGAVIMSQAPEDSKSKCLSFHNYANGLLGEQLTLLGGGSKVPFSQDVLTSGLHLIQMKGREIFKSAVRALTDSCLAAMTHNHLQPQDVDWFIPHQANIRIIQAVGDHLRFPAEKTILTLKDTGNTSSASIPIALDLSLRQGRIKPGDTLLFATFGAGLTYASCLLRI